MGNGSMLPPDVRQNVERQRVQRGGGIGSGVHENADSARQREIAMNPDAALEREEAATAADEKVVEELKVCPNGRCTKDLRDEWNYCAHCGADLMRSGALKRLGVTFGDDEMGDYIFKGYVVKELKILGKHSITVKSSQASDTSEIDDYLLNGSWRKNKIGETKNVSQFYLQQMQTACVTAMSVMKFDGQSIGNTLEERVKYLMERGSAFVDLISSRVVLFNQALLQHLKDADAFSGS